MFLVPPRMAVVSYVVTYDLEEVVSADFDFE